MKTFFIAFSNVYCCCQAAPRRAVTETVVEVTSEAKSDKAGGLENFGGKLAPR